MKGIRQGISPVANLKSNTLKIIFQLKFSLLRKHRPFMILAFLFPETDFLLWAWTHSLRWASSIYRVFSVIEIKKVLVKIKMKWWYFKFSKLSIVTNPEDGEKVALACMNTTLAGAGGAIGVLGSNYILVKIKGESKQRVSSSLHLNGFHNFYVID